jgi:putative SOS response-associated peptidase YedK
MCGRYVLYGPEGALIDAFELDHPPPLRPRYNVAPQTDVTVIRERPDRGRVAELMRWGLVPSWAKDPSMGSRMINARAETVASKPAFRSAFKRWRCIIPANGFYEWQPQPGGAKKQPFYVYPTDRPFFAFAGLTERWQGPDGVLHTCAIVTGDPNGVMAPIHDRMPCMLEPEDYDRWLDPECTDTEALQAMLKPAHEERTAARPVGYEVGNVRNEGAGLIEKVGI